MTTVPCMEGGPWDGASCCMERSDDDAPTVIVLTTCGGSLGTVCRLDKIGGGLLSEINNKCKDRDKMKGKKDETVMEREKKHEEFKKQLVDDVFGINVEGKVEMEKVTMLIWQFRDDPNVVKFLAQFVAMHSGTRSVFDGIEFYLPQLAHMIIHLEASWDDATLERFALIISQHSLHVALQLNWILQGAIEDYQPETADGRANV